DPSGDPYSLHNVAATIRATNLWQAGYTGAGVGVALIDSGVVPVQGLMTPGKIVNGPDLSFEARSPALRFLDSYGHGTFMAGITATGLADPAYDPFVISVGAADNHGSMQYSQWSVATFSQGGDGIRNPDILAPGAHIQSLRAPGSYIDHSYPGGMISDRFFR